MVRKERPMGNLEKPFQLVRSGQLTVAVLSDVYDSFSLLVSGNDLARDTSLVLNRVALEGPSFLTKTLPGVGKALDAYLLSGDRSAFKSCGLALDSEGFPCFMGPFWRWIRPSEDEEAPFKDDHLEATVVRSIRQVCYLLYKLEDDYAPEVVSQFLDDFVVLDQELPLEIREDLLSTKTLSALENARILIAKVLRDVDPWDIVPSHGPGSVATGERGLRKYAFRRYYEDLDEVYSYSEYFFFNSAHLCDDLQSLDELEPAIPMAKVVLVPKDSRGPRVISMEPLELQWIQQGLMKLLVKTIESSPTSRGKVNFSDQEINRSLALSSSRSQEFDTLDMKEASDRVSLALVEYLFPPQIAKCLRACRSTHTELPDGRTVELRKFAPMGSAVCFPVEALVFWALAVGSLKTYLRPSDFRQTPKVYVFGDDLIVPHGTFETIRPVFEEVKLLFNKTKCCTSGFFRESCGMDAYKGYPITPFRWKKAPHGGPLSPQVLLSIVAYSNRLAAEGYGRAAFLVAAELSKLGLNFPVFPSYNERIPLSYDNSTGCFSKVHKAPFRTRFNKRYQRMEIRVLGPEAPAVRGEVPGWSQLLRLHRTIGLRVYRGLGSCVSQGPELSTYSNPKTTRLRWAWTVSDLTIQY